MGRFDTPDASYAKRLERSRMVATSRALVGFEPAKDALYREHWVMLRMHNGRSTNWTRWGTLSFKNISIFTEAYPAFEIIEAPAFSLDGPENPFVRFQWCRHADLHQAGFSICDPCRAQLKYAREVHTLLAR